MVDTLAVRNFRGIQSGGLSGMAPATVLLGPNGYGKTALLEALWLCAAPSTVEVLRALAQWDLDRQVAPRWLVWKPVQSRLARVEAAWSSGETRARLLRCSEGSAVEGPQLRCETPEVPGAFLQIDVSDHRIRTDGAGTPAFESEVSPAVLCRSDGSGIARRLSGLYSRAFQNGSVRTALRLIQAVAPEVQSVGLALEGDEPLVHFNYGDRGVPAALAGDGLLALAGLGLELSLVHGGLLLIEEPEAHQHPRAIAQIAGLFAAAVSSGTQLVVTTHSMEFIDHLLDAFAGREDEVAVFSVQLAEGVLKATRRAGPDVRLMRQVLEQDLR